MARRFEFALKNLESAQWHQFERLARKFLSDDYPGMRTLASAGGDGGRDALVFTAEDDENVAIQISLRADWTTKIRQTVARLQTTHPNFSTLVYVTNQQIGPKADDLRRELRTKWKIALDIRDISWFVDREERSVATRTAADDLARAIVDPLLQKSEIIDRGHSALSDQESRAAILYLVLQTEDDTRDRQLTKLCFDSLVKTALRNTDNENRKTREEIYSWVLSVLATHEESEAKERVDRALERLNKRFIRTWVKEDEFCMNFDERNRLAAKVAELTAADRSFDLEVAEHIRFVANGMDIHLGSSNIDELVSRCRRVLEQFLFERGEAFVTSVKTGQSILFEQQEIMELASRDCSQHVDQTTLRHNLASLVAFSVERAVLNSSENSHYFLRAIADAYTLFAFLCETPNVQSAISKLFSQGEFWLDTSAVLPLLVEQLLEPADRRNSIVIQAVVEAGAKVLVTEGVVAELLHHIDHSVKAWRSPVSWNGRTPFLYASYIWAGLPNDKYLTWVDNFRGRLRPDTDLGEFLLEKHGIRVSNLTKEAQKVDPALRWQTQEYWRRVHERRKNYSDIDPEVIKQLAERDVENFLGVIQRRGGEEVGSPFGYRTWWLSLARTSVIAAKEIQEASGLDRLDSPVLSYDFLTQYLAVGPARKQLSRSLERRLPMMMDTSLLDATPAVLLSLADEARKNFDGCDERLMRRKIRDHLETAKLSGKRVGRAGIDAIVSDLRSAIEDKRRRDTGK